ncbi:uncharacterized protein DS421_9g269480 [Arachis hypogaea]|nr:uncharacterized protein DS421_9g269480 [Arachis hypogaea]
MVWSSSSDSSDPSSPTMNFPLSALLILRRVLSSSILRLLAPDIHKQNQITSETL